MGPDLQFFPLVDVQGFSPDWRSHSGFLPLAYLQGPDLHYAFLQISSPVPGAPNPYSMLIEYLAYEDLADTEPRRVCPNRPQCFLPWRLLPERWRGGGDECSGPYSGVGR